MEYTRERAEFVNKEMRTKMLSSKLFVLALIIIFAVAGLLAFVGAAPSPEWDIQTVDSEGVVGSYSSMALGSSGNPHISYRDNTNKALKYARWNGSTWEIQTVDGDWGGSGGASMALDSSDNPHISYYDTADLALKYARWTGSSWDIQTVDSEEYVDLGLYMSMVLDSSANPHISYYDDTNNCLKYARWTGSSWEIQTVEGGGGSYSSLVLDSSGNPHISCCLGGDLRYVTVKTAQPEVPTNNQESEVPWIWIGVGTAVIIVIVVAVLVLKRKGK